MEKWIRKCSICILLIAGLLIPASSPVFGNAGPPTTRPSDQKLIFDENSGISLKQEWVTIDLTSQYEGEVEVRYQMENLYREENELKLLFILPESSDRMEVFWNNEPVNDIEELSHDKLPENWRSDAFPKIIEPVSGKELTGEYYDYGIYGTREAYKGMVFSVDLPLRETGELTLTYPSYSGFYQRQEVINPVYHKIYYLTPALFWEGDAKVHLEFKLPDESYVFHSNIPMKSQGSGQYVVTLEKLPEEEWVVSYVSTEGLNFGTNNRTVHNLLVGGGIFFIILMSIVLTRKNDPRFKWLIILILPMFLLFRVGYGGLILLMLIGVPSSAFIGILGVVYVYRKLKMVFFQDKYKDIK